MPEAAHFRTLTLDWRMNLCKIGKSWKKLVLWIDLALKTNKTKPKSFRPQKQSTPCKTTSTSITSGTTPPLPPSIPSGDLIYRSNLLGSDQRVTNTGGGNTSAKIMEADPLTGESVEVLWVKGSGGDLRTSTRENFSSLYQEKLLGLAGDLRRPS